MKPRWKAFGLLTLALVVLMLILFTYIGAMGYFELDSEEVIETLNYQEGQELIVQLPDQGDVEITTWENDEIKIFGIKKTYFGKDQLDKIELRVDVTEDVKVSAFHEKKHEWVWMDIKINIPQEMTVSSVSVGTGNIHVRGIHGEMKLECDTGDIILWNCWGNISGNTDTGDIWVNNQGKEATNEVYSFGNGNFSFTSDTGDIWIKGLEHVTKVETSTGNIRIYESDIVDMVLSDTGDIKVWDCISTHQISGDTGDIEINIQNLTLEGIEIEVSTGDIDITVSRSINADYEITTDSGSVGIRDLQYEGSGTKSFKMGTINNGGPLIKATTDTGKIYIRGE